MLLVLVLACADADKAGAGTGPIGHDSAPDDTASDPDPPTPDPTFDLAIERGGCDALVAPWTASTAGEVLTAAEAVVPDRDAVFAGMTAWLFAAASGCPVATQTVDGDTTTTVYQGGCTHPLGYEFTGRLTSETVHVGGEDPTTMTADALRVRYEQGPDTLHYALDGTYAGDSVGTFWFDLVWGAVGTGDDAQPLSYGALVMEEVFTSDDGGRTGVTHAGYTHRQDERISGDLCFERAVEYGDGSCTLEPEAGSVTLRGAVTATVTWDGAAACDGCGAVTLDGVDLGLACPD